MPAIILRPGLCSSVCLCYLSVTVSLCLWMCTFVCPGVCVCVCKPMYVCESVCVCDCVSKYLAMHVCVPECGCVSASLVAGTCVSSAVPNGGSVPRA